MVLHIVTLYNAKHRSRLLREEASFRGKPGGHTFKINTLLPLITKACMAIQQKIDGRFIQLIRWSSQAIVSFVVVGLSGAKQSVDRAFKKTTPTFHSTVSKFIATATPSTPG